jgi:hypothetical protein
VKIKIVIPLILFAIVLNSCTCVETHLIEDEKSWFSAYDKGQLIVFKSNLGNLDTIVVAEKQETHNNKNCNWFEIGTIQPEIMFITLKSKICRNNSYCEGQIFISKGKESEKCFPGFSLFGLLQKNGLKYRIPKQENIKLIVTNKTYSQVYHFEDGVNANGYGTNSPKSFYWDKKDGLIKYEAKDGEVFELLKKIN